MAILWKTELRGGRTMQSKLHGYPILAKHPKCVSRDADLATGPVLLVVLRRCFGIIYQSHVNYPF